MPCGHIEKWRYSPTILNLGAGWKLVVSFMTLPLSFRYQSTGGWEGPRVWALWAREKSCDLINE
jgi:hypothetical protein